MIKNLPAVEETWIPVLGGEDPLEKGMAIHSSILAWVILWTEESGVTKRVGQDLVTEQEIYISWSLSFLSDLLHLV